MLIEEKTFDCDDQNINIFIYMSHYIDIISFVDLERSLLSYIALNNIQIHGCPRGSK